MHNYKISITSERSFHKYVYIQSTGNQFLSHFVVKKNIQVFYNQVYLQTENTTVLKLQLEWKVENFITNLFS